MSRRLRLLLIAVAMAALAWLLLSIAERALALAQRFIALPGLLQGVLGLALAALAILGIRLLWWLLRPPRARRDVEVPDRASVQQRIEQLQRQGGQTEPLARELHELDRRRESARLYVALFGEISTGKSSLLRALAPTAHAPSDVRGGTTRSVTQVDAQLPDGRMLVLADVPGSREADGQHHETLARQEALRAHAVIYLCAGELTRTQADEVRWLSAFGKPLLVALNKADQWSDDERHALLRRLQQQTEGHAATVLAISAGGSEYFVRQLADGTSERVERQRPAQLQPLLQALIRLTAPGAAGLETARERSVLSGLHERIGEAEALARAAEAQRIVRQYARRAIVGAMAAVAPGSDLLIQGVLAAGLTRALAELYGVKVNDVQVDDFVSRARLTVRSASTVVLAIAGNALKAFPGLGTLGGGVLHAFAYALIFDSMGRALAASLAERQTLDQRDAAERLLSLLRQTSPDRLGKLATLTREALRDEPSLPR